MVMCTKLSGRDVAGYQDVAASPELDSCWLDLEGGGVVLDEEDGQPSRWSGGREDEPASDRGDAAARRRCVCRARRRGGPRGQGRDDRHDHEARATRTDAAAQNTGNDQIGESFGNSGGHP
jgi:hypothetical protein